MATREALAFDLYGTLVDPIRIWTRLERDIPNLAVRIAEVWRQKQLEYTFRLTAMEQYEDFEQVTRRALDYALAVTGHDLDPDQNAALLAQYDDLEPFADVEPGLRRLREAGYQMVIFSNGSPRMIAAVMERAGLHTYLEGFVSVDEVRVYKPSPRVYRHLAARLDRPLEQVRLISSNSFDILGAAAVGMPVAWIDRSKGVFDTLGDPPEVAVTSLTELADALQARPG
ncbi:MAG: haloacid dehalogenase type II [Chloroflexi bacterium]|nr:haloacid dehalogenase type II [Chloroflexota bacterium]